MKKGFTLAEVLITLAVIGVVAALTIPVLINKYQKKQLYSQFMKSYNSLSKAMENAIAEYGEPTDWNWGSSHYNYETGETTIKEGDDPFKNYILSQLKVVKYCDNATDCFTSDYSLLNEYRDSYGNSYTSITDELFNDYGIKTAAVLADGMVIGATPGSRDGLGFVIDTNGKKGPNVMGRDLFIFMYEMNSYYNKDSGFSLDDYNPNSSYGNNCDPNSSSAEYNGRDCASRLLQEGAMNY